MSATQQHVAVSFSNGCAATDVGAVRCWGDSWDGRLGNGTGGGAARQHDPALVPVASNITSGATSVGGTCALQGQTVRCWGADGVIEDGTGSLFSDPPWGANVPTDYGHGPATKVAGTCALRTDGTVRCYGWNTFGALGNGSQSWPQTGYVTPPPSSSTAVTVAGLSDVIDLSTTLGGYCALRDDGDTTTSVYCWGANQDGQLGDGQSGNAEFPCGNPSPCTDFRHSTVPVLVPGLDDVVSVHGECAIRSNDAVSCWGTNDGGRFDPTLDGGSSAPTFAPRDIPAFAGAVDVAVGRNNACAVLADGTVRCQGSREIGDGGTGSNGQRSVVLAAFGNEPADEAVAIDEHLGGYCARTRAGTIACWGMAAQRAGIGVSGFDRVLTPTYVIGFGGALPEDELVVSVDIDPEEIELALDGSGVPVPDDTVVATVTIENTSPDDVPNVKLDAALTTTLERGNTKAISQVGSPTPGPDPVTSEVELGTIPAGQSRDVAYTFEVSDGGIFGVEALVRWADPTTSATETGFDEDTIIVDVDDGFEVELAGSLTESPSIVELTATIRNGSASAIQDLDWSGGLESVVLAPLVDGDGNPVDADPLGALTGPIPPLPTTLGAGQQVVTRWTQSVQEQGAELFSLGASGSNDIGPVSAFEELSAELSAGALDSADLTAAAADGLVDSLRRAHEELLRQWNTSIAEISQKSGFANETEAFRQREIDSWRQLGFGQSTAEFLAAGRVQRQTIENYFGSYIVEAEATIDRLGQESGEDIYRTWNTVSDPVKRRAFAEKAVAFARDELGYLADGYANPNTPALHETAYDDLVAAGTETIDSIGFAIVGQVELTAIDANAAAEDPLAFSSQVGARHGGQGATVMFYTATGVVEEVVTGGLGPLTRAGRAVEGGIDGLRTTRKATDATEAGTDALSNSQRRLAEAEDLALRYQDLPRASTVDFDELERLGGFNSTDADTILQVVDDVKTKYGIDVEVVFRTAEPFSTGIDGVGKRAFTKEKAVGAMDLMLGAPPSLKGRVAIFEPQPLPDAVIDAMDFDNPGFKADYLARLETQQNNWKAFNDGSARTLNILDGSSRYGGVHAFDGAPGQKLYGVDFLEQLDDPSYLATRPDLTPAQIDELRRTPATFTNMELDVVDGAFTLSDNVRLPDGSFAKKPVISDYDGQAVIPANGAEWPAGVRSQVETFVHSEFKNKLSRYGRHGWSDTANDLPAELFFLPAEYIMSTTHPAAAGRVAKDLSRRFNVLADEFDAKATRLEALPATPSRTAEIAKLRSRASDFRTYTPEKIIEKWPTGEKTVVFTRGRISVGSNQGTGS